MLTLLVGTALVLGALAYVLYPVFASDDAGTTEPSPQREPREADEAQRVVDAIREVEFDRATGTVSADDYSAFKSAYTQETVEAMSASDAAAAPDDAAAPPDDAAEALIERYRGQVATCPACGERPEPAAMFCSSCGRRLSA